MSLLSSWIILPAFLSAFMARLMPTRWAPVKKLKSSSGRFFSQGFPAERFDSLGREILEYPGMADAGWRQFDVFAGVFFT